MTSTFAEEAEAIVDDETEEAPRGRFEKTAVALLNVVAVGSAAFHVWTAGAGPLAGIKQTTIHVVFAIILCLFNVKSATGSKKPTTDVGKAIDRVAIILEIAIAIIATIYVWSEFDRIVYELGYARPTEADIIIGTLMVVVLFDACRRAMGWAFPIIGLVTILYCIFGSYIPGIFGHSGQTFESVIANSFTSPLGIYGSVTATSATQIAIFVIFGALLMKLGGGDGFLKMSLVVAGRLRGGPGKVSVLSSALFGMVNGSAVANTASTGVITIPMMKKYGFPKRFAAAVEATASTGGQWTPPIMGAAVFLMAQLLGMSYYSIVLAAIIPAIIYYISFWLTVDSEAGLHNLKGLKREEIPRVRDFVDELVILIPAVSALLALIIMAYPVRMAGFAATVVLLVSALAVQVFWKRRSILEFGKDIVIGCRNGALTAATIGVLVAGSQIVVAGIGTTGVALNVGSLIFSIASASIILALVLAAIINIVLGLALPTVPSYLIAIAITGSALIELGATPLSVHMFALYFAVLGGLTPPIGATVFVASAIAGTDWFRASLTAMRIAAIAFVLPFVFVLRPELLLQGPAGSIIWTSLAVTAGAALLAIAMARYAGRKLRWWESVSILAAAAVLFYPNNILNYIGAGAGIVLLLWWLWRRNRKRASMPDSGDVPVASNSN
ncbi:TRAP transporter permease [Georgenia sp. Z1344]|uniref:TRAP transporter permease n=1 Tax=Georgenia sp. Z1344 TaxID=3416706 RepID=UPI003CED0751